MDFPLKPVAFSWIFMDCLRYQRSESSSIFLPLHPERLRGFLQEATPPGALPTPSTHPNPLNSIEKRLKSSRRAIKKARTRTENHGFPDLQSPRGQHLPAPSLRTPRLAPRRPSDECHRRPRRWATGPAGPWPSRCRRSAARPQKAPTPRLEATVAARVLP